MKRNQILRELMRQKGLSTADIARETGIPYTTLKSIFYRGVEKSSYGSICSICTALGITTDELELLAGELAEKRDGDRGMSLEIQDFSEEELNQLQHYIRYLKFLRKQD